MPRAAFSHSASVGSRPPAQAQKADASCQSMNVTGWSRGAGQCGGAAAPVSATNRSYCSFVTGVRRELEGVHVDESLASLPRVAADHVVAGGYVDPVEALLRLDGDDAEADVWIARRRVHRAARRATQIVRSAQVRAAAHRAVGCPLEDVPRHVQRAARRGARRMQPAGDGPPMPWPKVARVVSGARRPRARAGRRRRGRPPPTRSRSAAGRRSRRRTPPPRRARRTSTAHRRRRTGMRPIRKLSTRTTRRGVSSSSGG